MYVLMLLSWESRESTRKLAGRGLIPEIYEVVRILPPFSCYARNTEITKIILMNHAQSDENSSLIVKS